jgi:hypothetical protein
MTYTVKNVKTFESPDGGGYNATLYLGKTKVAYIHDGGYGGAPEYDWVDTVIKGEINPNRHFSNDFYAFLKTHKIPDFEWSEEKGRFVDTDEMIIASDELFIGNLVNDFLDAKFWKARLKKKVYFLEDGEIFSCRATPSELDEVRKVFNEKFPNRKILNGLPIEEVLAITKDA